MKLLKSHRCFEAVTEFYEHESSETRTKMKFAVHRPENIEKIKGGLIWLSGLTCTDENFITKAGAQRVLSEMGLAVICPDTSPRGTDLPGEHDSYDFGSGAGFYVDATTEGYKDHYRMYSYINNELYELFNSQFKLHGRISIFGHSMGGHGALTIGLKNPEKYKSISAFSPIANPAQGAWGRKAFTGYLGSDTKTWSAYDACELLRQGKKHKNEILVEQGLKDEFFPAQLMTENLENAAREVSQNLQVNYREGYDHSYYFISTFIENHLRFHQQHLSSK